MISEARYVLIVCHISILWYRKQRR